MDNPLPRRVLPNSTTAISPQVSPPFFLRAFFCPFSFVPKQNEQAEQSEKAEMLDREAAKGIDLSKLVGRIERETAKDKPDHALQFELARLALLLP